MNRPPSIVRFEQLYLAAFVVGLIATALGWRVMEYTMATDPRTAGYPALMPALLAGRAALVLLFWWLAARRGSVVGKWGAVIVAVLGAVNLVGGLYGLSVGSAGPITTATSIVADILFIWAATLLFRPDAQVWFGAAPVDEAQP